MFSERLKLEMEARDWKPVQLCAEMARLGVEAYPGDVYRWLSGTVTPRLDTARTIADALGVTLDRLVPPKETPA